MQFDEGSVDVSGVEDRRGGGFGGGGFGGLGGGGLAVGGGGLGIVGLIIVVAMQLLGGGGGGTAGTATGTGVPGGTALGGGQSSESVEELRQRCNTQGALEQYTDCRLIKVYNVADDVWQDVFARTGQSYQRPTFTIFSGQTRTGCGAASASTGPFYCPADQRIYFDLDFLEQLQRQFGAGGEFAQAYIVAHEFGHHIQNLTGTERRVRAAQQRNPSQQNELSVAMELQADCYAGVWSRLADERGEGGIALTEQDVAEAVNAAEAVGDDRIQSRTQGRVDPESFTHGTAEQRRSWFVRGLRSGDPNSCDTFAELF